MAPSFFPNGTSMQTLSTAASTKEEKAMNHFLQMTAQLQTPLPQARAGFCMTRRWMFFLIESETKRRTRLPQWYSIEHSYMNNKYDLRCVGGHVLLELCHVAFAGLWQ